MDPTSRGENPYASPKATSDTTVESARPRLRGLAIFLGVVTDIAFSTVAGVVLVAIVALREFDPQMTPEELAEKLTSQPSMQIASLILGALGTMLGGYVAAWVGKGWPLWHALTTGVVSLVIGIGAMVLFPEAQPLWLTVCAFVFTLPAAALGGLLRAATAGRRGAVRWRAHSTAPPICR